jgi:hypothetical protein
MSSWQDNNQDGDNQDLLEHDFPLLFEAGTGTVVVKEAIFDLISKPAGLPPFTGLITGTHTGDDPTAFHGETVTVYENGVQSHVKVENMETFGNVVNMNYDYEPYQIDWAIEVTSSDNKVSRYSLVKTEHKVYVLMNPELHGIQTRRVAESIIDILAKSTHGTTGGSASFDAFWAHLETNPVHGVPKDGYNRPIGFHMGFWNGGSGGGNNMYSLANDDNQGNPVYHSTCHGWSNFMKFGTAMVGGDTSEVILFKRFDIWGNQYAVRTKDHSFLDSQRNRRTKFLQKCPRLQID